ncbi:MAG: hypothetical protein AB1714_06255 [Acidobacteriota bacterium]
MGVNNTKKTAGEMRPEEVDDWLRHQLEPSPEQASRVVQRALAAERYIPESRGFSWRTAAVAAICVSVFAVLLAVILMRFVHERSRPPGPVEDGSGSPEIAAIITNQSGQVELRLPAGTGLPAGAERIPPRRPSAAIFNLDGLVVARVTDGGVRYIVIGGDR